PGMAFLTAYESYSHEEQIGFTRIRLGTQSVRLQETLDEIPDGGTPHTVSLLKFDKLVDTEKPGDRVEVTGVYREMSIKSRINTENCKIFVHGDPGTSKSQIFNAYTSSYLVEFILVEEEVLESGVLVLSDRGICCIDKFDKMLENGRSILHEVMEEQAVLIAKAGIITLLNARTSVLDCANPSGSRYNPRLSVIEITHLPPTLLSRFDLIYLLLDKADEVQDRHLAKYIVALHFENPEVLLACHS
ncbi:hypothetical protein GIB67_012353, partial [Kingdonia uniflora]